MDISFGDRVRVRETPDSSEKGLAGMVGDVMGFTTPSKTGVTVIGQNDDYAMIIGLVAMYLNLSTIHQGCKSRLALSHLFGLLTVVGRS